MNTMGLIPKIFGWRITRRDNPIDDNTWNLRSDPEGRAQNDQEALKDIPMEQRKRPRENMSSGFCIGCTRDMDHTILSSEIWTKPESWKRNIKALQVGYNFGIPRKLSPTVIVEKAKMVGRFLVHMGNQSLDMASLQLHQNVAGLYS